MIAKSLLTATLFAFSLQTALADAPHFMSEKKKYASDWRACVGFGDGGAPDDSYTIDATGIVGYEFDCQFIKYDVIPDLTGQGRQNNYIATASCSDDSGISRPDLFTLSFYDDLVSVTSQNDYVYDLIRGGENPDGQPLGFINKSFELCSPD